MAEQLLAESKTHGVGSMEAQTLAAQATAHFSAATALMTQAIAAGGMKQSKTSLWQHQWGIVR